MGAWAILGGRGDAIAAAAGQERLRAAGELFREETRAISAAHSYLRLHRVLQTKGVLLRTDRRTGR
jgi:hypothetical protein